MSDNCIHIFFGDSGTYEGYEKILYQYLSFRERARAERFRRPKDKLCYLASHGLLKKELCKFFALGREAEPIYNASGKPGFPMVDRDFNLSHADHYFAYVIADTCDIQVGIDIEMIHPIAEMEEIAKNHFSAKERTYLQRTSHESEISVPGFYEIWTRKEAFLKMTGMGLAIPLQDFSLVPGETEGHIEMKENGEMKVYACKISTLVQRDFVISLSISAEREPVYHELNIRDLI